MKTLIEMILFASWVHHQAGNSQLQRLHSSQDFRIFLRAVKGFQDFRISGFRCRSVSISFRSWMPHAALVPSLYMLKGSRLLTVQIPFAVRRMHRSLKCTYWDVRYVTFYHELSKPTSKQSFGKIQCVRDMLPATLSPSAHFLPYFYVALLS